MDASSASLVSSSAVTGQSYTLPGPRGVKVVVTSTDARVAGAGPLGPIDNLVGLTYKISYAVPLIFDQLA
jgi:hypothetical protein